MILLSKKEKNLSKTEYRFWVTKNEIITSAYYFNNKKEKTILDNIDIHNAEEFVLNILPHFKNFEEEIFVIDIGSISNNYKLGYRYVIIEINSAYSSEFYNIYDIKKLLDCLKIIKNI